MGGEPTGGTAPSVPPILAESRGRGESDSHNENFHFQAIDLNSQPMICWNSLDRIQPSWSYSRRPGYAGGLKANTNPTHWYRTNAVAQVVPYTMPPQNCILQK